MSASQPCVRLAIKWGHDLSPLTPSYLGPLKVMKYVLNSREYLLFKRFFEKLYQVLLFCTFLQRYVGITCLITASRERSDIAYYRECVLQHARMYCQSRNSIYPSPNIIRASNKQQQNKTCRTNVMYRKRTQLGAVQTALRQLEERMHLRVPIRRAGPGGVL